MSELLLVHARLATMRGGRYSILEDAALHARYGMIEWIGPTAEASRALRKVERIDAGGTLLTPGLVDCHTHLVYAGDRAREFEMRLAGASYEEIARAGGGIVSTVAATRKASEEDLATQSLPRLKALMAEGVTTAEIKSGYGLDEET